MLVALPLAVSVAALAAQECPGRADPRPITKYALVASGGISLGAYEAGVTYIILKYLRSNEAMLPVATGASAGNINVFLAALSWFQSSQVPFTASDNLFWDTWINIGLDKLLPADPDPGAYARLFERPASAVGDPFGMRPATAFAQKGSVYSRSDGLLSRAAFQAVNDHLADRLGVPSYEKRGSLQEMRLAVTLTLADAPDPKCTPAEPIPRFVAPMVMRVEDQHIFPFNLLPGSYAREQGPSAPIHLKGNELNFPVRDGCIRGADPKVGGQAIFDAIEASSAFPVAFGPKLLDYCLPVKEDRASACQGVQTARFSDGGLFDNVPLGAAIDLAGAGESEHTRYIYILPDLRRLPFDPDGAPSLKRGSAALGGVLGNYLNEARSYELQGISRYASCRMGDLFIVDRFFPVVGEYAGAFGAFVRTEYRIYDYVIGLYDGLHAIAALEARSDPGCRGRDMAEPACVQAISHRFDGALDALVGQEAIDGRRFSEVPNASPLQLEPFLRELFAYEVHWTTSLSKREVASLGIQAAAPGAFDGNPVGRIYKALRDLDAQGRTLAEAGFPAELARAQQDRGSLTYLMSRLPPELRPSEGLAFTADEHLWPWQRAHAEWEPQPRPDRYGLEEWTAATLQRLLRRASDIEKIDAAGFDLLRPPTTIPPWVFSIAQVAAASAVERGPSPVDLGMGTLFRLATGERWGERVAFGLLPQYLMKDLAGCGTDAGWDVRLRAPEYGWLAGVNLGLEWNLCAPQGTPYFGGHLGGGVGYDPRGRLIDDVQVNAVYHRAFATWTEPVLRPGETWSDRSWGLELSVTFATKIRLAAGWRDVDLSSAAPPVLSPVEGVLGRLKGPYASLGVADFDALAWLAYQFVAGPRGEAR